jgi:hypothetical protein
MDDERNVFDRERKFSAAENRRRRSKRAPQREGHERKRAGGGRALKKETAGNGGAGQGGDAAGVHRLPPAGVIAWISYMPPGPFSIVKFTRVPGLSALRSTEGLTGNSMVMAGQPISGIGL